MGVFQVFFMTNTGKKLTFFCVSSLPCSPCSDFLIPKAMLLSDKFWQALIIICISFLTRHNSRPLSAHSMVTCLMSSSQKGNKMHNTFIFHNYPHFYSEMSFVPTLRCLTETLGKQNPADGADASWFGLFLLQLYVQLLLQMKDIFPRGNGCRYFLHPLLVPLCPFSVMVRNQNLLGKSFDSNFWMLSGSQIVCQLFIFELSKKQTYV